MISVVTYLWGTKYRPAHVQRLAASVARWLAVPHQFVCFTDQRIAGVTTRPDPTGGRYPKRCYRRLWLFSEAARALGEGILHLDLDLVLCGPLDGLVRPSTDLAIYKAGSVARRGFSLNPSVLWLRPGTQTDIWRRFQAQPSALATAANADGWWGSDQAVISYLRRDDATVVTFGESDGVVSFRHIRHAALTAPPPGTCVVSFHGKRTPFERDVQAAHPWILDAWKEAA